MLHKSSSCFWVGVPLFKALFLGTLGEHYHTSEILPKIGFWGQYFCCIHSGCNFNHCVIGPKCPDFGEITQNNGIHYAFQGHSRSSVLVVVYQLKARMHFLYVWTITYVLSCIISEFTTRDVYGSGRPAARIGSKIVLEIYLLSAGKLFRVEWSTLVLVTNLSLLTHPCNVRFTMFYFVIHYAYFSCMSYLTKKLHFQI